MLCLCGADPVDVSQLSAVHNPARLRSPKRTLTRLCMIDLVDRTMMVEAVGARVQEVGYYCGILLKASHDRCVPSARLERMRCGSEKMVEYQSPEAELVAGRA